MYHFIYYFFYTLYQKRKGENAKIPASVYTWFAQFIHLVLLLAIIKYLFSYNILYENSLLHFLFRDRFYAMFWVALPWIIILYKYYNTERISTIEQKYIGIRILTLKNSLLMVLFLLVPFIIVIRIAIITTVK
jgi:hypothetical protein